MISDEHSHESPRTPAPRAAAPASTDRRTFLARGGGVGLAAAFGAGVLGAATATVAKGPGPIPAGDLAILRFLAAAELLEDDLWQQYCELAVNNPGFHDALSAIDPALPRYICDDRDDERSHANLINGFLVSIGAGAVNLDPFRTLPSVKAPGAQQTGRLTNLTRLTVDTSFYTRYRSPGNPDFGDAFPQLVTIANRATIPTTAGLSAAQLQATAHAAAFHFAAIEQGGGSLYTNLSLKSQHPSTRMILAAIGPTEIYHFAAFHKSLEGIFGLDAGGETVFPDLRSMPALSQAIFPEPCRFLDPNLQLCSVIRPSATDNAGAVATAVGLVNSGIFAGQSRQFLSAAVALAQAADAAG